MTRANLNQSAQRRRAERYRGYRPPQRVRGSAPAVLPEADYLRAATGARVASICPAPVAPFRTDGRRT